jgi:sortase (surface protein transpeptidase)
VWASAAVILGSILVATSLLGLSAEARNDRSDQARDPESSRVVDLRVDSIDLERRPQQSTSPTTTTSPPPPVIASDAPNPRPDLVPVAIRIPAVRIDSGLIPLGLNDDNTLEVPHDFAVAGWYIHRAVPGEQGPSIIVGHVDSKKGPALFYRLREVELGATIEVERSDGSVAVFTVTASEQHDKDTFPTERVYDPTSAPELRVITCGGRFNRAARSYDDNVIVFAALNTIVPPT